jgi:NADH-quinone oxidoreductase subunit A
VKFFLVAMIFIVFDIEIIFMFPFATVFRELGGFGIAAILIFSAAVFESFVYLISNGALDWGPAKNMRRSVSVSPARTSASNVRVVGLEGRDNPVSEEAA